MTRTSLRRGFNLIEAAIVLGVIGLVIGGIWIAAATVNENRKVNEIYMDAASVVDEIYSRGPRYWGSTPTSANMLQDMGIVPKSYTNIAASTWTTPGGMRVTAYFTGSRPEYTVTNLNTSTVISRSFCIKLSTKLLTAPGQPAATYMVNYILNASPFIQMVGSGAGNLVSTVSTICGANNVVAIAYTRYF